jgi:hypothetical protein
MPTSFGRTPARLALALLVLASFAAACADRVEAPASHRAAPANAAATTAPTSSTTAPATTAPPTTAPPATAPPTTVAPPPPVWAGKGMWIWQPEYADGGDGAAIVARAQAEGIKTLYIRTGSSHDGLTMDWALAMLPIAHAAGMRVIGWDFPELDDVNADVSRAVEAISSAAIDGSKLDGFAADIETQAEGTNLSPQNAYDYGVLLRAYRLPVPLIAVVPNPSPHYQEFFPYADATAGFDAIAPMVYWLDRDPATDVASAVDFLSAFGKPVAPIGQAFDGGPEGGREGLPTADELAAFAATAKAHGAAGLSFWSWQHADDATFASIGAMPEVGIG